MGQYPFDTIIIINLKRRKDKLDRILSRVETLGLDKVFKIVVFDAVDGRNINQEWLDKEECLKCDKELLSKLRSGKLHLTSSKLLCVLR